jgi:hypothetical protein
VLQPNQVLGIISNKSIQSIQIHNIFNKSCETLIPQDLTKFKNLIFNTNEINIKVIGISKMNSFCTTVGISKENLDNQIKNIIIQKMKIFISLILL